MKKTLILASLIAFSMTTALAADTTVTPDKPVQTPAAQTEVKPARPVLTQEQIKKHEMKRQKFEKRLKLTDEQKEIIDKDIDIKQYQNKLIRYTAKEYEAQRNQEVRRANEEDQKYARRRPKFMIKTDRHVGIDESELESINTRIAELEQNMTTDDFDEYRKLIKMREELEAQKEKAENWEGTKQKSRKQLRQERRDKKLQEDAETYGYAAYRSRPEEQKDLGLEDFVEGYKKTQQSKKRKRRKNKEEE